MEKYCPHCHTRMIDRSNVHICPRNIIGECTYDGYQAYLDQQLISHHSRDTPLEPHAQDAK